MSEPNYSDSNIELINKLSELLQNKSIRIIVSNPRRKSVVYKHIEAYWVSDKIQIAKYSATQVFHENMTLSAAPDRLSELVGYDYKQINAFTDDIETIILVSKDGSLNLKTKNTKINKNMSNINSHNRKKQYIIDESADCPALVDMGVVTKEGKIVASRYDKFRQINRFVELIDDELKNWTREDINIIDFGCGKSYLTFVLYYYLTAIRGINCRIIGLDLKESVIEKCNKAAKKYGYNRLSFEVGDINGYELPFSVDMVITLHACDMATDYALANAVNWGAGLIFSVPCCQHELNSQIEPKNLQIINRYGIIKERFAALATDSIRANALEYMGYRTQVLEFVDMEHTPKNILIRAVRKEMIPKSVRKRAKDEIEALVNEFGFDPAICRLLHITHS